LLGGGTYTPRGKAEGKNSPRGELSQELIGYSTKKGSYPIRGIDPDKNFNNGNSDLLPDEIGQIGTKKKVQKIKVKGLDNRNKVKLNKFSAENTSNDNIQDSGVLSMEGKTNRFVTEGSVTKINVHGDSKP
jgi:hypothetical protein